jgi:hypothetical protein
MSRHGACGIRVCLGVKYGRNVLAARRGVVSIVGRTTIRT